MKTKGFQYEVSFQTQYTGMLNEYKILFHANNLCIKHTFNRRYNTPPHRPADYMHACVSVYWIMIPTLYEWRDIQFIDKPINDFL